MYSGTNQRPRSPAQSRARLGELGRPGGGGGSCARPPTALALTSAARTARSRRLPRTAESLRDLLRMSARQGGSQLPRARAESHATPPPARPPARPHLHQALGEEATTAPKLSTQPAPCGPLAHLPDHVPGRQAQLVLFLRAVSGQDQRLCGRRMARARGSEEPIQGRLAMERVPGPVWTAGERGGGVGFYRYFHAVA